MARVLLHQTRHQKQRRNTRRVMVSEIERSGGGQTEREIENNSNGHLFDAIKLTLITSRVKTDAIDNELIYQFRIVAVFENVHPGGSLMARLLKAIRIYLLDANLRREERLYAIRKTAGL